MVQLPKPIHGPAKHSPRCAECGGLMVLRRGPHSKFYGCANFPSCTGTHGAHSDGTPLGVPGNAETKAARIAAHEVFDELWRSGAMSRSAAYRKLARAMGRDEVHFGEFSKEECEEAIQIVEEQLL